MRSLISLLALVLLGALAAGSAAAATPHSRHAMAAIEARQRFAQRDEVRALTGEKVVLRRHVRSDGPQFRGGRAGG